MSTTGTSEPIAHPAQAGLIRRLRTALASGWVPALAVYVVTVLLVREQAQVTVSDSTLLTGYVLSCLTIPGLLVWRWLSGGRRRPLAEDLVLGTIVGYVIEIPAYVLARWADLPWMWVTVPLTVVIASVATRSGRHLWRSGNGSKQPVAWSWTMAGLLLLAAFWLARNVWSRYPVTSGSLRSPYVDEPFQLALATELKHHFPAEVPFVDGVPLFYHWFTYVHVASSSWTTGVEPVVLLRVLAWTPMVALTILGVSAVTNRLTRGCWPGVCAAGLLVLVGAWDVFGWTDALGPRDRFLDRVLFLSPTQTFAAMVCLPLLLMVFELLSHRREVPVSRREWVGVAVFMFAVAGIKSSVLPVIVAGLIAAVVLSLVLNRRLDARATTLTLTGGFVLLLAQQLLYGGGARALTFDPLATVSWLAAENGLTGEQGDLSPVGTVLLGGVWALSEIVVIVGAVGLLHRAGWRTARVHFVAGCVVAGFAAALGFDHPGLSQLYFVQALAPIMVIASACGLERLVRTTGNAHSGLRGLLAAGAGALAASLAGATTWRAVTLDALLLGWVLAAVVMVLVALAVVGLSRGRDWPRGTAVLLTACAVLGMGAAPTLSSLQALARVPWPDRSDVPVAHIGLGGIAAARWVRAHSSENDLVATNVHCRGEPGQSCDHRHFWVAGYTERHVLVEGWSYIAPESVGLPSTTLTNSNRAPFWDQQKLRANDRAFIRPSQAAVRHLSDEYGVDWLFVDLRYPVVMSRLTDVATLRFRSGDYAVLEIGADR